MPPSVSLLLSVKNGERYLRETIDSWLKQRFSDFEILVWDNGSEDRTAELVRSVQDRRLRLVRAGSDAGLQAGWFGLTSEATGEFCLSPDADDIPAPALLERLVSMLRSDDSLSIAHAGYSLIDNLGHPLPCDTSLDLPPILGGESAFKVLLQHNPIKKSAALVRTSAARLAVNRANHRMLSAVDWYFWFLVLAGGGNIGYCPDLLLFYRVHADSLSRASRWAGQRTVEDLLAPWCGLADAALHSEDARRVLDTFSDRIAPVLLARILRTAVTTRFVHPETARIIRSASPACIRHPIRSVHELITHKNLRKKILYPCSGFLAVDHPVFRRVESWDMSPETGNLKAGTNTEGRKKEL
ncbi:MAG: glycosyltransferase [bacterium]